MDLDATVKGINVNADDVEQIVASIASIPLDDGVSFYIKSVGEIMDEAEYPGIRVSEVENSRVMENLWLAYQKKFSYASEITWKTIMESVRNCMGLIRMEGRH